MKAVTALLALVAALALASAASAANGSGNATMAMGTVSIDVATGTTLNVAAHPVVFAPGATQQSIWDAGLGSAQRQFPGQPLDVYTVACWQVAVAGVSTILAGGEPVVKCGGAYDSGAATDLASALAQTATGTLGTGGLQMCSWLGGYSVTDNSCVGAGSREDGVGSPSIPGNMVPNLDAFVGQIVTFNVLTNWCSYIAPVGYDVLHNLGYGPGAGVSQLGCANEQYGVPIGLASASSGARTLAAAGNPLKARVKVAVKASAFDCHVPRVKGLTLRAARARLRAAHCSVGYVVRVRSGQSGRVRYQPLKAGTGRPKGYGVTLAVTR